MSTDTDTSETGLMVGAHPTAPGGMSRKALVTELVTKHGWTKAQTKPLSPLAEWPRLIEAVIEERRNREAEQQATELLDALAEPLADIAEQKTDAALADAIEHVAGMNFNEVALFVVCEKHEVQNCAECSGVAKAHDESLTEQAAMFDAPAKWDDDIDPEELMAEITHIREAEEQYQMQHGLLIKHPTTLDYVFNGHAGAGPSASERWMHCTASLGASREFLETLTPNQQEQFAVASTAARQGTTAHAAAEVEARVILGEMTQEEADLTLIELSVLPESDGEAYDDEMGEYITEYVDLVRSYAQDRGDDHVLIESRVTAAVPLTDLHEGEVYEDTGSADCIVLPTEADPTLVVTDLKYGNGIDVDVRENSQARIYGLGALGLLVNDEGVLTTDVETVTYHIAQPRLGGIKTWSEPLADLLRWRDEVLAPRLTAALYGVNEGAVYAPSDSTCQFCPARGGCAALAEDRLTRAADLFDVVVAAEYEGEPGAFPETAALTDTRLGELLQQITGLIDIHKDLKAEAERRLYRGDAVPGFQLVNYSPPRKWKDGAEENLPIEDNPDLWQHKLVSPTAAEKMLGEEYAKVEALVDKPDKRPVVAKEGDRRKPWTGRPPEAMFTDETEKGSE